MEDRYGLAVLDRASNKLVYRWSFSDEPALKGMMSVYSGIEAFSYQGKTYIVWGVSQSGQGEVGRLDGHLEWEENH